jgi:phosphoglycolate phosphatase-like HAD superfamily hydrolase
MPGRHVLIFDLDGTLIDTMGPLADLFCDMLREEHGVAEEVSRPIYVELAGKGPRPQFKAVLSTIGRLDEAVLDDITARYWVAAERFEPAPFPETASALAVLRAGGHAMAVSSGGTTPSVQRKLRRTGIDGFFPIALGTDEGVPGMRKGPGHLEIVARSLALRDGELQARGVFVGDAVYDMQVARDAGIRAVGRVSDGNASALRSAGAQHLIQDLREIEALLAAL